MLFRSNLFRHHRKDEKGEVTNIPIITKRMKNDTMESSKIGDQNQEQKLRL